MTDGTYFGNAFKSTSDFPKLPIMSDTWKGKEYFFISSTANDHSEVLPPNSLFSLLLSLPPKRPPNNLNSRAGEWSVWTTTSSVSFFSLPKQCQYLDLGLCSLNGWNSAHSATGKNAFINGLISLPAEFIFRESQPFSLSWISIYTGPCKSSDINQVSSEIRGVGVRQRGHNRCLHAATMLMTRLRGVTLIPNVLCVLQKRAKPTCQDLR